MKTVQFTREPWILAVERLKRLLTNTSMICMQVIILRMCYRQFPSIPQSG